MSNLSLGYHPQLLLDFGINKSKTINFIDKLLYSFQGIKKFCCVGDTDISQTTGIVKICFVDEKG